MKAKKKIEHVKKYRRVYDRAHKQASDCEPCKKTYLSVSALRRHHKRNIKCHMLHEKDTREKLHNLLQERASNPEQEKDISLKFLQLLNDCLGRSFIDRLQQDEPTHKAPINQTDTVC